MKDFTMRLYQLPFDYEYGGKDLVLQAQLWNFIEKSVQSFMEGNVPDRDPETIATIRREKLYEIVDITVAKTDLEETVQLEDLDVCDREKKKLIRDV